MSAEISTKNDAASAVLNNSSASVDVHFNVSSQIKATLKLFDILSNMHKSTNRSIKELANFVANDAVYTVLEESSVIPYQYRVVQTADGKQTFQSVYNGQAGGTIEEMYASSLKENMDTAWYTPLSEVRKKFLDENGYEQAIVFSGCSEVYNTNYFYILENNKKNGTIDCVSIEFKGDAATAQKLIERLNGRSHEPVVGNPAIDAPIVYGRGEKLTITEFLSLLSDYYGERKQDETTTIRKQEDLVGNIDQYKKGIGKRIKDIAKLYKEYLSAWKDDLEGGIRELCPIAMRLSRGELSVDEALALVGRKRTRSSIFVAFKRYITKRETDRISKAEERGKRETTRTEHNLPLKQNHISKNYGINFKVLLKELNPIMDSLNLRALSRRELYSLLKKHPELTKNVIRVVKPKSWVINRASDLVFRRGWGTIRLRNDNFRTQQSASSIRHTAIRNQQSATRIQQPAASNQQSATRLHQPVTSNQQSASSIRQSALSNPQSAIRLHQPVTSSQLPQPVSSNQQSITRTQQSAIHKVPAQRVQQATEGSGARRAVPSGGRVSARSAGTPVTRPSTTTAPRRGAIKTPRKTIINDNIIVNERQLLPVAASDPRRGATKTLSHRSTEELRIKRELEKMLIATSLQEPLKLQHGMQHGNPTRVGNDTVRIQQSVSSIRQSAFSNPQSAPRLRQPVTSSQLPVTLQSASSIRHPAISNQQSATRNPQTAIKKLPAQRVQQTTEGSGARRVVPSGERVSARSVGTPVPQRATTTAPRRGAIKTPRKTIINDNIIVNERQLLPVAASDPRGGATKTSHRATEELRIKRELQKMRALAQQTEISLQQSALRLRQPATQHPATSSQLPASRFRHPATCNQQSATRNPQTAIKKLPAQRVQQTTEGSGARRAVPNGDRFSGRSAGTPVATHPQITAPRRGATKTLSHRPTEELRIKRELQKMRAVAQQTSLMQPATQLPATLHPVASSLQSATRNPQSVSRLQQPATRNQSSRQPTHSASSINYRELFEQELQYQKYLKSRAIKRSKQKLKRREKKIRESLEKIRIASLLSQEATLQEPLQHSSMKSKKKRESIEKDTLISFFQFLSLNLGIPLEIEEWRFEDERALDIDLFMVLHGMGIDIDQIEPLVAYIKEELSNSDEKIEQQFDKILQFLFALSAKTAV